MLRASARLAMIFCFSQMMILLSNALDYYWAITAGDLVRFPKEE